MTHEFYAPFFHLPGRYEWCTIHAEHYGSFDCFIVIHSTTDQPVTVYLSAENGRRFMAGRFPESTTIQVSPDALRIEARGTRSAGGYLEAQAGPVRHVEMEFNAEPGATPAACVYGAPLFAVWGSRFSCEGVDLNLAARARGRVLTATGAEERFADEPGIITSGSYGRLTELRSASEAADAHQSR